jgi:toxin ParE1/3/4
VLHTVTPIWSPEAIDDLASLRAYIAEDNPAAAQRVVLHILHNAEALLSEHPAMGRPGRVPGTRELMIPDTPFVVPYRVQNSTVQVLRVFTPHAAGPRHFEISPDDLSKLLFPTDERGGAQQAHFDGFATTIVGRLDRRLLLAVGLGPTAWSFYA